MTIYSYTIQPIFGARVHKLPHIGSRVITECSIMHYNENCFFLHRKIFEYDKFRTQFLIEHALSTLSVHS